MSISGLIPTKGSGAINSVGIRRASNGYIVDYFYDGMMSPKIMVFLNLDDALVHIQSIL